ncbi:MAG: hypothetical protein QW727_00845 [Candidatus Pacearchaeota archaeon]
MKDKKAQLKIKQMIFMLLALTIFFVLVALFFISIKSINLEKEVVELKRDRASNLVEKLSSTPEFIFENKPNSIDADKLIILQSESIYRTRTDSTFWGVEGIIVRRIYPKEREIECTKFNYPECNIIKLFTEKNTSPTSSFVSWCRKQSLEGRTYDKCELAELMIIEEKINEAQD